MSAPRPIGSCADCFAWGQLSPLGRCTACYAFGRAHEHGRCLSCRRPIAVKKEYCRLCWTEASRRANADLIITGTGAGNTRPLARFLRDLDNHQLFFTDMAAALTRTSAPRTDRRRRALEPGQPFRPPVAPGQLRLFDATRDLTHVARRPSAREAWLSDALTVPHIAAGWDTAQRRADACGWPPRLLADVRRTLLAALCCRPADEPVRYSELLPLAACGLPVERPAEVLADIGMLDDDRPGTLDRAFGILLKDVAPAIRSDVQDWLTALLAGTPRAKPRSRATAGEYLRAAAPVLTAWSSSHGHLREITAGELSQTIAALPAGSPRTQALVALRSLFRYLRAHRRVFRDPAARLSPGAAKTAVLLPLATGDYQLAVAAAATPEHRLALVLSASLAARPADIRALRLDAVDLGERRITIAGHACRLDDLTCRVIAGYLTHRRASWPQTANPHVLVSQQTAKDNRPVVRRRSEFR
jgi:hypothetical protein